MFYEELYTELGKLFYYIANTDGNVQASEKKSLQQMIKSNWKALESSTDQYGTDKANVIDFAFDYEEAEGVAQDGFRSFETFYLDNKSKFTPDIISNILQTGKAVAEAYRSKNRNEREVLDRLTRLFE